jgi:putative hydrolase of HD superfamily
LISLVLFFCSFVPLFFYPPATRNVGHHSAIVHNPSSTLERGIPLTNATRLDAQIGFIIEIDKLKQVMRRTQIMDGSRHENSAEHSWHLALMAITLGEHAPAPLNLGRVIRMLVVHDLVEIDAGDTFAFDAEGHLTKTEREQAAADRIFGLLPDDQRDDIRELWEEFEAVETAEARYALAIDRLEPLLCNLNNGGGTWRQYGITRTAVLKRMDPIREGAPGVWPYVVSAVNTATEAGWIAEG